MDTSRGEKLEINVRLHLNCCAVVLCKAAVHRGSAGLGSPAAHKCAAKSKLMMCAHCEQIDFTLPKMPCGWVSLDVMDVSGEAELDVVRVGLCVTAAARYSSA